MIKALVFLLSMAVSADAFAPALHISGSSTPWFLQPFSTRLHAAECKGEKYDDDRKRQTKPYQQDASDQFATGEELKVRSHRPSCGLVDLISQESRTPATVKVVGLTLYNDMFFRSHY